MADDRDDELHIQIGELEDASAEELREMASIGGQIIVALRHSLDGDTDSQVHVLADLLLTKPLQTAVFLCGVVEGLMEDLAALTGDEVDDVLGEIAVTVASLEFFQEDE